MTLKSAITGKVRGLLVKGCDRWIKKFDPKSGKFLEENGGWAVTNQDNIFLAAYLYLNEFEGNRYYGNKKVLDIIKAGGDALRNFQTDNGKVLFVKPDGSTWGYTYMPWSMFHWLQTYELMQGHLDKETLENWKAGLILAYDGIRDSLKSLTVHNIPVWNSTAIYRAGTIFNRPDYIEISSIMIEKTLEEQHPDGFWPEHQGPTLSYNAVYVYALAVYKLYGGPVNVDIALQRAFAMQQASVYPDGSLVETADGRVKYDGSVRVADMIGYLELEGGLYYTNFILDKVIENDQVLNSRMINLLRYLEQLPENVDNSLKPPCLNEEIKICHGNIQVIRKKGWQVNLSSYTAPITDNRWGMDRQMFLSVWHKDKGLLIGGGNTKYIPKWGTFHITQGEDVTYVPDKGIKLPEQDAINLYYGNVKCFVKLKEISDEQTVLEYGYQSDEDVSEVLIGLPLKFSCDATENDFYLGKTETGNCISFKGYNITLNEEKYTLKWPVEPFNPYEEQGRSPAHYSVALLNIDITKNKTCIVKISKKSNIK